MNDKVNGPVELSSYDSVISACVVFDIEVYDKNRNIIKLKGRYGNREDRVTFHRPFIVLPYESAYAGNNIIISDIAEETKIGAKRNLKSLTKSDHDYVLTIRVKEEDINDIVEVMDAIRSINVDNITQLMSALQNQGMNCVESNKVIFDGMVYLHLEIRLGDSSTLDPVFPLESMMLWFTDPDRRRITSAQLIFPTPQRKIFSRMKIGSAAGHKPTDQRVVRDIHCRYCYRKMATGTIKELVEEENLKDVCEPCQEVEDDMKIAYDRKDPEVTRTYKISGKASIVDNLEVLFREISILSNVGASREIKLYVDGDGAVDLKIEREDGEKLKNNCRKHGYLKREKLYGEGHETGRLTYLDLG